MRQNMLNKASRVKQKYKDMLTQLPGVKSVTVGISEGAVHINLYVQADMLDNRVDLPTELEGIPVFVKGLPVELGE